MNRTLRCLTLALLLTGCDDDDTEQPVKMVCTEASRRALRPDEQTSLGTPQQWATKLSTVSAGPISIGDTADAGARTSPLTVRIALDTSAATLIKQNDRLGDAPCPDVLEVASTLTLTSGDGTFADDLGGMLSIYGERSALAAFTRLSLLKGSFRPIGYPATFTQFRVDVTVVDGVSTGSMQIYGDDPTPEPPYNAFVGSW